MENTFEYWGKLKSLPLPSLDQTIEKYLEWVEPILSPEDFHKTKILAERFLDTDGPVLQKKLENWANDNSGDWLKPLWHNMYLDIRDPLCINVNYFIKLMTSHLRDKYAATEIAGVIITKLFQIYDSIVKDEFEPETIGDTPLCMSQYKNLFKAARIPKRERDQFIVKPATEYSYIILMHKNNMYKMTLRDENGDITPYKSIVNTLNSLINLGEEGPELHMGILTTAPRDEAAEVLERILSIQDNKINFEILQDALFMVCIDEDTKDLHHFAHSVLCSDGNNRYFDKNIQLIFNKKGDFAFNDEHTGVDGSPWIKIFTMIGKELEGIDGYTASSDEKAMELQTLDWYLSEDVQQILRGIKNSHIANADNTGMKILYFDNFGKKKIGEMGYSPDAFFHAALQLAQYRTFGSMKSTYEPVAMRTFRYGRTECCRPVTVELSAFVKAWADEAADAAQLKELMKKALEKHKSRLKECQKGEAIERHLYGLLKMQHMFGKELSMDSVPEIFRDKGYKTLKHDFISTSAMGSKYFEVVGFGPVVSDGFGLCYGILDDKIAMCLTYKKDTHSEDGERFADEITKALDDLFHLAYI